MKKKLMGLLAAVLAVSMTTSAFAADTGFRKFIDQTYGDGNGVFGANDVLLVQKKIDEGYNLELDVDSDGRCSESDIRYLYMLALRPKDISISKTIRVTAEGARNVIGANHLTQNFITRKQLGYEDQASKNTDDIYGTGVFVFNGAGQTLDEIKKDRYEWINRTPDEVSDLLGKVSFYSAEKGKNVGLRTADGWAKLSYALRYVIPLSLEDAKLVTATEAEANERVKESEEYLAGVTDYDKRVTAWSIIKGHVVGDSTFSNSIMQEIESQSDILSNAVVNDAKEKSDDEIKKTATEVMTIVGSKYPKFTVTYNGSELGSETITADGADGTTAIAESDLINGLIAVKDDYAVAQATNVAKVAEIYKFGTKNQDGKLELTGDENIVVETENVNTNQKSIVNVFLADTILDDLKP